MTVWLSEIIVFRSFLSSFRYGAAGPTRAFLLALWLTIPGWAQATYTFDAGGRLIKASYGSNGSINYTYDAAGNLIGRSVQPGSASVITSVATANGGDYIAQNTFVVIKGNNLVPPTTPAAGVNWSSAPSFA